MRLNIYTAEEILLNSRRDESSQPPYPEENGEKKWIDG